MGGSGLHSVSASQPKDPELRPASEAIPSHQPSIYNHPGSFVMLLTKWMFAVVAI